MAKIDALDHSFVNLTTQKNKTGFSRVGSNSRFWLLHYIFWLTRKPYVIFFSVFKIFISPTFTTQLVMNDIQGCMHSQLKGSKSTWIQYRQLDNVNRVSKHSTKVYELQKCHLVKYSIHFKTNHDNAWYKLIELLKPLEYGQQLSVYK